MRFWTQEGRLKRHYPLVIITLSTVVAYLISNLRTSLQQNELMWSHIRKLEMQRSSRSPKLDLPSDSVSAAAPPAFRPQSLAPSATARQPIGHPRGGLGWQGEHAATLRAHCGRKRNGAFYMQELIYPKDSYIDVESKNDPAVGNAWRFLLSLNDPQLDQVVSRGILNWLFSIPGTYASATEVHTLCTAVPSGAQRPLMSCTPGKVVVEIGAAIGMVSTYLAQRGMRVYSLDPVLPNVERLAETACINGVRHCLHTAKLAGGAKGRHAVTEASRPVADARAGSAPLERCKNASLWGDFSPANFRPIHALADSVSNKTTTLAALPSNLAATNPAYTSDSTGLSRCLSPSIRFVCARTLRCARSGMRIPSHSYTFWTWSIIREAGSPSWRGSVSSVALDAIVQQDGHGQDIELLHMCPQGSEWAVLQGASRLLQAGRIRHILFGKMLWIRRLFLFLPHLPPPLPLSLLSLFLLSLPQGPVCMEGGHSERLCRAISKQGHAGTRGAGKHQDIFFPQDAGVSVPQCGRLWAERGHDGSCYGASARPQSPTGASLAWATCFQSESPFKGALATRMQDNDIQSFHIFICAFFAHSRLPAIRVVECVSLINCFSCYRC